MLQRWSGIALLWGFGVLAVARIGKLAALTPLLRQAFDRSLPQAGGLISLIEAGGQPWSCRRTLEKAEPRFRERPLQPVRHRLYAGGGTPA